MGPDESLHLGQPNISQGPGCGPLELAHPGSQKPTVMISEILQGGC